MTSGAEAGDGIAQAELDRLARDPPPVAAAVRAVLDRYGVKLDLLSALTKLDDAALHTLDDAETDAMTPIPSGLPTIGPATMTLLRMNRVTTAFDVLKPTRPSVENVGPARWAVLEDWAKAQAPDRGRLRAAQILQRARDAYLHLQRARESRGEFTRAAAAAGSNYDREYVVPDLRQRAKLMHDAAREYAGAAAKTGLVGPLTDLLQWEQVLRQEDAERLRNEEQAARYRESARQMLQQQEAEKRRREEADQLARQQWEETNRRNAELARQQWEEANRRAEAERQAAEARRGRRRAFVLVGMLVSVIVGLVYLGTREPSAPAIASPGVQPGVTAATPTAAIGAAPAIAPPTAPTPTPTADTDRPRRRHHHRH